MSVGAIKIGIGIGGLRFGMERTDVAKQIGDPESVSENGDSPNRMIAWNYWRLGLSLYFSECERFRFTSATVEAQEAVLWGRGLSAFALAELKELFLTEGYSEFHEEATDDGSVELTVDDAACVAFFKPDGQLRTFDWYTLTDDETEKTIWPG